MKSLFIIAYSLFLILSPVYVWISLYYTDDLDWTLPKISMLLLLTALGWWAGSIVIYNHVKDIKAIKEQLLQYLHTFNWYYIAFKGVHSQKWHLLSRGWFWSFILFLNHPRNTMKKRWTISTYDGHESIMIHAGYSKKIWKWYYNSLGYGKGSLLIEPFKNEHIERYAWMNII